MARARDPQIVQIEEMFSPAAVDAETKKVIESIEADFKRLATKVHKVAPRASREKSLVLSHLQDAKFHAVHAVTHPPQAPAEAVVTGTAKTVPASKAIDETKPPRKRSPRKATAPVDDTVTPIGGRRSRRP